MATMLPRLRLAHLPTPLWQNEALDRLVGCRVWVKRDDMTGGAEAGNKIRKLEYLLADALARGATTVITCGAAQSNHARATALLGRQVGLRPVLLLRTPDPARPPPLVGNLLLDQLVGAELRFISAPDYDERDRLMREVADELGRAGESAYVIPEGGSNGLGAHGYIEAMREVHAQMPDGFDAIVHACGSGGTAAGTTLGAAEYRVAPAVHAIAVCADRSFFEPLVRRIMAEARQLSSGLGPEAELVVHDAYRGPAYGVMSREQMTFLGGVARSSGLILDPVYSGKALFALAELRPKPERVLFLHTGGLPGLLAQSEELGRALA
jgi:D-cysteine desulfhydrase